MGSKFSEFEPAEIEAKVDKTTLHIRSKNVDAILLKQSSSSYPKEVSKVFFNQIEQKLAAKKDTVIGLKTAFSKADNKNKTPSQFVDFFRNEPLYIVYQDEGLSKKLSTEIYHFADELSMLHFQGFPEIAVSLPKIPLSLYPADSLEEHRAIFIGLEQSLRPLISHDSNKFPIKHKLNGITVRQRSIALPFDSFDKIAYSLSYPSSKSEKLKLAFLLAFNELEGLLALKERFLSATALYHAADLVLFTKNQETYSLAYETSFSNSWEHSALAESLIEVPLLSKDVWREYLKELLIEESQTERLLTEDLIYANANSPSYLNFESIKSLIPAKVFASIHLEGARGAYLASKIMKSAKEVQIESISDLLDENNEIDALKFSKTAPIKLIIEAKNLAVLTKEELAESKYKILAFSMQEILLRKLSKGKAPFGRALLRVANKVKNRQSEKELAWH